MGSHKIESINVIGAGTMGSGIAQLSAQAGYQTAIYDLNDGALEKAKSNIEKNLDGAIKRNKIDAGEKAGILERILFTSDFYSLNGDLVIEAIVEKLEAKVDVFNRINSQTNGKAIFATNTSSIPVTRIAASVEHPERVVGMHFFNPAHIMKLVEVISGAETDPEIAEAVADVARKMGKQVAFVKDSPGFIVNRVARSFYLESLKILEENVADHEDIDAIMESCGFRMGPFRLMDLIGIDTNHSVSCSMFDSYYQEPRFRPNRIQRQKVEAGHIGKKSGRGFYDYSIS